jgi:hypothetical protein
MSVEKESVTSLPLCTKMAISVILPKAALVPVVSTSIMAYMSEFSLGNYELRITNYELNNLLEKSWKFFKKFSK